MLNSTKVDFGNRGTLKHRVKKRLVFHERIKSCMGIRQVGLIRFKISHKTLDRTVDHYYLLGASKHLPWTEHYVDHLSMRHKLYPGSFTVI